MATLITKITPSCSARQIARDSLLSKQADLSYQPALRMGRLGPVSTAAVALSVSP